MLNFDPHLSPQTKLRWRIVPALTQRSVVVRRYLHTYIHAEWGIVSYSLYENVSPDLMEVISVASLWHGSCVNADCERKWPAWSKMTRKKKAQRRLTICVIRASVLGALQKLCWAMPRRIAATEQPLFWQNAYSWADKTSWHIVTRSSAHMVWGLSLCYILLTYILANYTFTQ